MLVFIRQRLVLLATPKTGSTALQMALMRHADIVTKGLPGVKHISYPKYLRQVAPLVEGFARGPVEVCALMRAPVDWLGSWYRYRKSAALAGTERSTAGVDFDGFLEAWLSSDPPAFARVGTQGAFLTRPQDGAPVPLLWRYEALDGFADWLAGRLGVEVTLPQANVSALPPEAPSPALRARAEAALAPDMALWRAARG